MSKQEALLDWSKPWTNDEGLVNGTEISGGVSQDIFDAAEWSRSPDEGQKIAALIAAAPDMLAALRNAMVVIDTIGMPDCAGGKVLRLLNERRAKVLAAIAKAEGR